MSVDQVDLLMPERDRRERRFFFLFYLYSLFWKYILLPSLLLMPTVLWTLRLVFVNVRLAIMCSWIKDVCRSKVEDAKLFSVYKTLKMTAEIWSSVLDELVFFLLSIFEFWLAVWQRWRQSNFYCCCIELHFFVSWTGKDWLKS